MEYRERSADALYRQSDEKVAAHRDALRERTHDRVPLQWATTQNNLGNALQALGQHESDTARLEEARSCIEKAWRVGNGKL